MGRVLLSTLLLLHLVLVPSTRANIPSSWRVPFGLQDNGIGLENPELMVRPDFDQDETARVIKPQPVAMPVEELEPEPAVLADEIIKPQPQPQPQPQPAVVAVEEKKPQSKGEVNKQVKKPETKPLQGYQRINPDKKDGQQDGSNLDPKDKTVSDAVIVATSQIGNLKENFYAQSCPRAEQIVSDWLTLTAKSNPNAISNLLRLTFHDCFVGGCDASVLLDYVPSGEQVEKSSLFNGILLKGADLIDDLKAKLEHECPQTVSCADALAFATLEAMAIAGLPRQRPLGGRRDAKDSLAKNAENDNLPLPNWTLDKMIELFQKKGFNTEEMVILIGAHSVGSAHCDLFMNRAYNFDGNNNPDPFMPLDLVNEIKGVCTNPGTPRFRNPPMTFDETPTILDNLYFKNMVEKKRSLLISDSHFIADPRTIPVVQQMAADPQLFTRRISELLVKLTTLNVLTGNEGEIRKSCRSIN